MDPPPESGEDTAVLKEIRQSLEATIDSRRTTQRELLCSLHSLVPDLVPTLNLSLRIISAFNNRPFEPTVVPSSTSGASSPNALTPRRRPLQTDSHPSLSRRPRLKPSPDAENNGHGATDTASPGDPLSVVRTMIAVCLLELVPFHELDSSSLLRRLESENSSATTAERTVLAEFGGEVGPLSTVEAALRRMEDENGGVKLEEFAVSGPSMLMIMAIDRNKLLKELPETPQQQTLPSSAQESNLTDGNNSSTDAANAAVPRNPQETRMGGGGDGHSRDGRKGAGLMVMPPKGSVSMPPTPLHRPFHRGQSRRGSLSPRTPKPRTEADDLKDIEELLNKKSFREMQKSKTGEELLDLIHRPTAKETAVAAKFKTKGGPQVKEYCSSLTKEDCRRQSGSYLACEKVHFKRIIAPHTETNLGDCSFLDTCRHTKTCKYVHYEYDPSPDIPPDMMGNAGLTPPKPIKTQRAEYCSEVELGEPQWINCDIRNFRMDILGKFGVIMADPPWDIHMELPYGTMADDEMRNLNVPALQTDGLIFLWVTGRAMELGRECLELWGYKRVEELIWVKTNQLQRIIRTGRTGHWLNHSKEHCLVGIKGDPEVNRNIDTDVIVAEVRETSRKPDEMYPMLERISPRTRKLELFARMHNTHAGWLSLGNQLLGVRLVDEGLRARFKAAYPEVEVQPPSPPRTTLSVDIYVNRSPFTSADAKQSSGQPVETGYASEGKPVNTESEVAT